MTTNITIYTTSNTTTNMKYEPNNPLNKTKELQKLHEKILQINTEYTKRHEEWLRIKFTLKEMVNKVSTENMAINNNHHEKQLGDSIRLEGVENERVNTLFNEVFCGEYVGDVLRESSLSTADTTTIRGDVKESNNNTDKTDFNKNLSAINSHLLAKPSITKRSSTTLSHNDYNDEDIVRLEIQKQRHKNTIMEKEIMILEKELGYLEGYYCRDYDSKKNVNDVGDVDNRLGEEMDSSGDKISNSYNGNRNYSHEELNDYNETENITCNNNNDNTHNNNDTTNNTTTHNNNDTELQSQISCLNKLINHKLMLINELQEQNEIIKKKNSELKAKQSMLLKRKLLLEVRESELNKKLYKKEEIIEGKNKREDESIHYNKNELTEQELLASTQTEKSTSFNNFSNHLHINKPITESIKESAIEIHELISSSLDENIKQQQREEIREKFNLTV